MKHWLLVLVSLGLAVMSGIPAWAVSGVHGRRSGGTFPGFAGGSSVRLGVPAIRPPAAQGATARVASASAPVGSQPVLPKMIVLDSSGLPQTLTSAGSLTTALTGSSDPKVLAVIVPIARVAAGPKIIVVSPSLVSQRVAAKVILVKPSVGSRRRGLTLIGIAVNALGPHILLGPPCDFGVSLPESCAPVDSAALVVEAAPTDAQVFLDGQLIGTAGELSGQTLVIPAGPHGLEIVSPGAGPFRLAFTATPGTPTRIHAGLVTP